MAMANQMTLESICELLGLDASSLTPPQRRFLVESVNDLLRRHGRRWLERHKGLLQDQWEIVSREV